MYHTIKKESLDQRYLSRQHKELSLFMCDMEMFIPQDLPKVSIIITEKSLVYFPLIS